MNGDILIVGGYGAVGQIIATRLAEKFPGQVIAAGRNGAKAEALAQQSGGKVRPYQLNLADGPQHLEQLPDVGIVVMCLDVPDMQFVQACLQRGIHYVDITAQDEILRQIEDLDAIARANNSTALLSVGLSPGLTNLLARQAQTQFDGLHQVDICIFLGLGERHGEAAARWTLHNLNANYQVRENGRWRQVSSFGEYKQVAFPVGIGARRVYRFNLADQHVVVRTLDLPSVSTWITFDPVATTRLIVFLRRTGLLKLLNIPWIENTVVKMSKAVPAGSSRFVIQITAQGEIGGRITSQTYSVTGNGEGKATGLVTAQVVEHLLSGSFPPGVFHSEQVLDPLPFIHQLAADDIVYRESEPEK